MAHSCAPSPSPKACAALLGVLRNRLGFRCVQVHVGKKLAIGLCVLVLAACDQTVQGKAVSEDARQGRGVDPSATSSSSSPRSSSAVQPLSSPVAFDPCGFDDVTLEVFVRVDPATKVQMPEGDGCSWKGEDLQFAATFAGDLQLDSLGTTPGVTDLTEMKAGGQTVQLFVYQGVDCVTLSEIEGRTVQFMMIEKVFDPYCFNLRVATRLLLEAR